MMQSLQVAAKLLRHASCLFQLLRLPGRRQPNQQLQAAARQGSAVGFCAAHGFRVATVQT